MVVPQGQSSHWDYFHLLGSLEDNTKFNYAVKLYLLFLDDDSDETREYILNRVIGALGALSNSMRAGAYSLFCTLLANCPEKCDFDTINKVINNVLKPSGTLKADAEAYVGQLLAYKALVQSGFLDKSPAHYSEIAEGLMDLALKKSYLYAEGLNLLGQITEKTKQEYGSEPFIRHLRQLNDSTLDKLSYLLKLDQNIEESEILVHLFDGKRLLTSSTAPEIGILLAKCHNSSHTFLSEFLNLIADNHKYVDKMWKSYESQIKDKLDSNKNILDMYYALLSQILKQMLSKKQFKSIKTLVSDLTVATLLKHSKSKPEQTRDVCKSISDVLIASGNSSSTSGIINKLVFSPGNFSFDEITGSKLVGSILRTLAAEETKDFGDKCLKAAIEGEGLKNKDRVNALNLFCSLLHSPVTGSENQWRIEGLTALLKAGLLVRDNVSAELSALIRKSFFNNISGKFESLEAYSAALRELTRCLSKCVKKPLRIKITEEMKMSWALSQELLSNLEKQSSKKAKNKAVLSAIELLTCFISLKSINEPKESQLNLADIKSVLQRITKSTESAQGPEWVEVLMDLFLNMLSKPNASNRMVINIVFKSMVPHLNDGAFLQLVEVLDKSYDLNKGEGDQDDGQEGEDSEEDDEGSEEESSDDSDDGEESKDEEDDTEEDEDDDMDDEDMNSRAFNQEKLQFDLRQALMPPDSDTESINIEDMDEEQGKQLDATLSAIFRNAMLKKKPSKRDSVTSHFKTRVLDLLETYCSLGMPIHHWQMLIPKVLDLADACVAAKNAGGLKGRLLGFVRQISNSKIAGRSDEDFEIDQLIKLMDLLVTRAANASGASRDLKVHFGLLIKFCVRNSHQVHPNNQAALKKPLADIGVAAVSSFFTEKGALDLDLIMYLCANDWCGVHDAVRQVIQLSFSPSATPHDCASGITLLTKYFKNERLFASLSDAEGKVVKKIASSLLESVISLQSETGLDPQTQNQLIQLMSIVYDSKSSKFIKWSIWKEQLPQLLAVPQKQSFASHFHLLCKKLGLSSDQFSALENGSASMKKKKKHEKLSAKKRKRNEVDARKLKKESKRRRLAAMDGLEGVSWSQLAIDE